MAFDLSLEFTLSAKPAREMQLLTDAALIRKWSGEEGVAEKIVGGKFEMFGGWVTGKVLKVSEDELAYTWRSSDWSEDAAASEVHYLLKKDEAGTKVILKHTGLPSQQEADSHKSGWTDYFFDPMEDFILIIDKS